MVSQNYSTVVRIVESDYIRSFEIGYVEYMYLAGAAVNLITANLITVSMGNLFVHL